MELSLLFVHPLPSCRLWWEAVELEVSVLLVSLLADEPLSKTAKGHGLSHTDWINLELEDLVDSSALFPTVSDLTCP